MTTTVQKGNSYVKTHFRIETGYVWGEGHTPELRERFQTEIIRILAGLGFTIQEPKFSGSAYSAMREKEELYLHPMDISGKLLESSIPAIEQALEESEVIQFRMVDTYDTYYDCNKETVLQLLHDKYTQQTYELVFNSFQTKRKTKFVSVSFDQEPIQTIQENVGKTAYQEFVQEIINDLVTQGLLIQMNSESSYYRSLNKTELKTWEKANGKISFLS